MHIDRYEFGCICVDGVEYRKDLILLPDRVVPEWRRRHGHKLSRKDLGAVVEASPEVLVVGAGAYRAMRVPEATVAAMAERGIELVAMPTAEACDEFNRIAPTKRTAAALHLTC